MISGDLLRTRVRQAIEVIGTDLLDGQLIHVLQNDANTCREYYEEVLRVVYRVMFLLFAEQRGQIPRPGAKLENLYRETHGTFALCARTEIEIPRDDDRTDLWRGLQATFQLIRDGDASMGVLKYDGGLFEDPPTSFITTSKCAGEQMGRACSNSALLHAIRALTLIEREGVLQRISYADLDVEVLGSIYESLLGFIPRVTTEPTVIDRREVPANTFFLDPRGLERKSTGAYYTHSSLVDELLRSALLPVTRNRLMSAGLPVVADTDPTPNGPATKVSAGLLTDYAGLTDDQRTAGEIAILSMTVCDPSSGSGHFLVKANNTLGIELARIRTGDEYPDAAAVQAAKCDVLAACIYGVDLNSMAIELCKISLWLNASVVDWSPSRLGNHIKCGNSLIGTTPELMENGVPTDAFEPGRPGDDPELVRAIRARNDRERRGHERGTLQQLPLWDAPGHSPKRRAGGDASQSYYRKKLEADFWTAAFFWPMPKGEDWAPTSEEFMRLRNEGPGALPSEHLDQISALAEEHRFFHWYLEFPEIFNDNTSR